MKFAIPEISWHNRDPVLSVDFQPKSEDNGPLRLATGGTDTHVVIWYLTTIPTGSVHLEVAADLTRHQKAVNVVRWSPNGQYLASGDDESIIFIWKQKAETDTVPSAEQGEEQYKETWVVHKTLRGHMEDVLDISWSADSTQLASGSVDNKLLVWDVCRGKYSAILSDHKGFVQGVSWDPCGQFIVTASTDRVFRTFDVTTKKVVARSSKAILPFPTEHPFHNVNVRLYHDDTLQTYYRRLHFSPDGMLIAVPSGRIEPEHCKLDTKPVNAVYIYTRYSLKVPACVVPCGEPALAVRWSPARLALRPAGPRAALPLPQPRRLLLAVGTRRAVLLYDTQQCTPLALISNMHYTRLTDLSWSPDGRCLVASSTDGFCSVVTFGPDELGHPLAPPATPATPAPPPRHQPDQQHTPEPMEIQNEELPANQRSSEPVQKSTNTMSKIDSFMTFKPPSEKSPKQRKSTSKEPQKTPVKLDVLMETAMPSWSDNSNTEIIKPVNNDVTVADRIEDAESIVIDDSEDFKLVYEETEDKKSESLITPNSNEKSELQEPLFTTKKSSEMKTSPKQTDPSKLISNSFMTQAKVTDIKPSVTTPVVQSPKVPRRVSFITLSSPKTPKRKV